MNCLNTFKVYRLFYFNFKRHYKIWLSPNPNEFLPMRNQLRLIHAMQINPGIEMRLVYSQKCLNYKAIEDLKSFCAQYKIIAVEFESLLEMFTGKDSLLAKIAMQEIDSFLDNAGGNLGAASDCIRLIKSIIEMGGIYSDLDVKTSLLKLFANIPDQNYWVQLKGPVLFFGLQMSLHPKPSTLLMCNNDFLAFSSRPNQGQTVCLSAEAEECLNNVQDVIVSNYTTPFNMNKFFQIIADVMEGYKLRLKHNKAFSECIQSLVSNKLELSIFLLRARFYSLYTTETDPETKQFLHTCLKLCVIRISGPEIYHNLFVHLAPKREVPLTIPNTAVWSNYKDLFLKSSIGYYDALYELIKSKNEHHSVFAMLKTQQKAGGDFSWMPEGRDQLQTDSKLLAKMAGTIGQFWRQRPLRQMNLGAVRILELPPLMEAVREKRYALACRKAAVGGEKNALQVLIECKQRGFINFDVNEASSNGRTALDWVVLTKNIPEQTRKIMIQALHKVGAEQRMSIEDKYPTLSSNIS